MSGVAGRASVDHLPRWNTLAQGEWRAPNGAALARAGGAPGVARAPISDAEAAALRDEAHAPAARIVLLGTGVVGRAFLARLAALAPAHPGVGAIHLAEACNSRHRFDPARGATAGAASTAQSTSLDAFDAPLAASVDRDATVRPADLDATIAALGERGTRIVVDATASDDVAARHVEWLARGLHVVTACKLGAGTSLARAQAIRAACARGGTRYGDSATVGAGLPVLRTLRALVAGGERVHAIAGVLSGSLAWILSRWDGTQSFSSRVEQARRRGYTEPDPREDLAGEDVRRKLLILVRAAGIALEEGDVEVESLAFADDAHLAARRVPGQRLHYVARWDARGARAGLESLPGDDPLAEGGGTDNRIALWTDRYRERPLILQGPGAGAEVTAAALLDDVLAIASA